MRNAAPAGAAAVRSGRADAYITDESTLQWYAGRQPCDLSVQGENFGPGVLVYGLQKDSPFTKPLNAAMLEVCGLWQTHLQRTLNCASMKSSVLSLYLAGYRRLVKSFSDGAC